MFPDNWGDHCHETDNIDRARVHFAYLGYFLGYCCVCTKKIMQDTSKCNLLILETRIQFGNAILTKVKEHTRGDPGAIKLLLLILSEYLNLLTS